MITEHPLGSRENFISKIERYYSELAGEEIPAVLLQELVEKVTEIEYSEYIRFWNQYPKSRKRYSELKMEDLEHPFLYYSISWFLKEKDPENYKRYSMILFKMSESELSDYEYKKYLYENK